MQRAAILSRARKKSIGFVPTMGALHEGHLSLVRTARRENDVVVASIFVNPTQFGPKEDFESYPRTLATDRRLLKKAGVDYLFVPAAQAMYPEGFSTTVDVGATVAHLRGVPRLDLASVLCGKFRPGHFRGVAMVVAKLFGITKPDKAYFGAKDYQQAAVIKQLVRDLNMGIEIKVLPTVREKDGIAMSSRNRRLKGRERLRARAISETLFWLRREIRKGRRDLTKLRAEALARLRPKVDRIDYFEIVDPETLESLSAMKSKMVALTACFVGKTRLIDNVIMLRSSRS